MTVDETTLIPEPLRSTTSSGNTTPVLGSTTPRLFTPPLIEGDPGPCGCGCALTSVTSYGFAVERFARDVLGLPLDPWERWLVIHAGELLADGRPRFRKLLIIVARQNGKTHLLTVLALFWLFVSRVALILGTSTNLDYARESWEKAVELAEENPVLAPRIPKRGVRSTNGQQTMRTTYKSRYKIAASNGKGGRSLTVHRLILDELREHRSWEAWNAAYLAMNAVRDGQAWAITNQGEASAVVLNSLRSEAIDENDQLRPIDERDVRLGLFEWSAPIGSRADDPAALAMANPNLGRRIDLDDLLADARRALRNGGEELAKFLTEILCMRVQVLDPAVNMERWHDPKAGCLVPGTLDGVRSRVALVFDVSLDGQHATLCAAALLDDGKVRVEPVAAWESTQAMRRELPDLVARIRPRALGWFPNGPAAAVAADMAARKGWPPAGVKFAELSGEATAVCMGFADLVDSGDVLQSGDPLLDAHVGGAEKLRQGDAWRFTRRGAGHCDAAYAAAGAVHLARTLPPEAPRSAVY